MHQVVEFLSIGRRNDYVEGGLSFRDIESALLAHSGGQDTAETTAQHLQPMVELRSSCASAHPLRRLASKEARNRLEPSLGRKRASASLSVKALSSVSTIASLAGAARRASTACTASNGPATSMMSATAAVESIEQSWICVAQFPDRGGHCTHEVV